MRICTIDFETMGLDSTHSSILEFGYVIADNGWPGKILATKSIVVPDRFNQHTDRTVSLGTVVWWLEQIEKRPILGSHFKQMLRKSQICAEGVTHGHLYDFIQAIEEHKVEGLFCTDKSFDYIMLLRLLSHYNLELPLTYKQIYETRFWKEQSHPEAFRCENQELVAHTAQDDALMLFHSICRVLNG